MKKVIVNNIRFVRNGPTGNNSIIWENGVGIFYNFEITIVDMDGKLVPNPVYHVTREKDLGAFTVNDI